MSYIKGAMTAVVLVFPIILLYKLWYERRRSEDSNANNDNEQLADSTSVDDTSIVKLDSTNPSSSFSSPELTASTLEADTSFAEHDSPDLYSSFPSVEYEVFLSFRGPDTRRQITDILYRFLRRTKIHVFRDDNELRKGEEIGSNLRKAIDQSKIYVPIISKSYAHSKWCLIELAEIIQRHEQDTRRTILPIFYMVDPRDVRHQTGPYEDAFQEHGKKYDERTIKNWKDALNKVGALKGWHVKNNDEKGAVADEVSADLLSRLSKENFTLETDELVGIDDHVEVVVEKLNLDSTNLTMVGLHGMGGIGKTTIAKAVYNKISSRFDRCCFLENIRETQAQKDGIVILQKRLVSEILRMDSVDQFAHDSGGRKMIKERVSRFKSLIVLDDVDEKFRFQDILGSPKDFVSESRFIITSRNVNVLITLIENEYKLYEVGSLNHPHSLELFCKHAFRKNSPPVDYETLADDIVHNTGGLPLTLKVIGSLLFRQETAFWKDKLEQLRETLQLDQVMDRLKISYDTLAYDAQQIFLDIACFFIGTNKEMPSYMWSDCKLYPMSNINILVQRSMIKVGSEDEFQMHDQLRDMGREIIRQENIEHPWMRSRIWSAEEGKKLIYERKMAERLKVIDLSECSKFRRLPRFPRSVEILKLNNIEGPELDIGDLKKLKVLYLNYSILQKITGGTFGMLKGLQELDLTDFECENLREVMVDVGQLSSLKILRTKGVKEVEYETPIGLKELYTSSRISNLAEMLELEVLKIDDCKFGFDIPPMWWKRSKLKTLSIVKTNINGGGSSSSNNNMITTMLPSSLTSLEIRDCRAWLPSLVNLGNLTDLQMDGIDCQGLCNHLDGIEGLTSLKKLRIQEVKGLARITGLTNLLSSPDCKLDDLTIFSCPDLIELHDDDKAAEVGVVVNSLRLMHIVHCPQLDAGPLVRGLTKFPMLRALWLENIKFTEHQLEGVGSLKELGFCTLELPSLERITQLSKLQKLKYLTIAGAHGLREIKGLRELKSLEYLILPNCTSLERLWHADDRMENLKKLDIRNCRSLSVEHLSALKTEIKGSFGKLKDLQSLNLAAFWCNNLKEGLSDIGELPSLEFLYVSAELDGIKHLKSLKMLNTSSSICNLAELLELEDLTVVNCVHGLDIPLAEGEDDDDDDNVWWKVSKLKRLELWWTKIRRRRSTSGESKALLPSSLTDFCVEGGGLSFEKDEELVWLPSTLENLENLTRLSLHGCPNLVEIRGIKGLKSLESLELEEEIPELGESRSLTMLDCPSLERLWPTDQQPPWLKRLKSVYIRNCSKLTANEKLISTLKAFVPNESIRGRQE
ncbi:Disease resistance protein L6 [Linum perenne]